MADFKGVSSSFRLNLVNDHGGNNDRVMVQIGMDGLKITTTSDNRTLRSYELSHISRWQSRDNNLVLYIKTPNDMEERQTTLSGDETTIRSALDTLTCCCMQLCELLQSKKTESSQEVANNLHALVAGGGKKKTSLPTADEVEYWRSPDKVGWLQSQGEVLKSWRKRWFVLKQGHLFRFKDTSVSESVKPRGVVDLSKVQDVKALPGKSNTIQLKTSTGSSVSYIADSETEVVEWISAIEGAIQRIVRHAAGMDDEAPSSGSNPASKSKSSSENKNTSSKLTGAAAVTAQQNEWASQLEKNFEKMASVNNGSSGSSGRNNGGGDGGGSSSRNAGSSSSNKNAGPALVNVVGYETISGGSSYGGGGGVGGGYSAYGQDSGGVSGGRDYSDSRSDSQQYGGGYGQNAGSSGVAGANTISTSNDRSYGSNSMPQAAAQNDPYRSNPTPSNNDPYNMQRTNPQQQQQSYAPPQASQQQQQQQQMLAAQQQQQYAATAYAAAGQAQQFSQQPQQQPQQQHQQGYGGSGSVSLMDQIPQQQPSYPYYQHTATAPQQPAASPNGWQIHHTAEGRPYYYNTISGTTTWETPVGVTM